MKPEHKDRTEVAMYAMNLYTTNDAAIALGSGALREQCQLVGQVLAWFGKGLTALGVWVRSQSRRAPALRVEPGPA
jgi:hypothetical protein